MNVDLNSFTDKRVLTNHSEGIAQSISVSSPMMLIAEGEPDFG